MYKAQVEHRFHLSKQSQSFQRGQTIEKHIQRADALFRKEGQEVMRLLGKSNLEKRSRNKATSVTTEATNHPHHGVI